VNIIKKKFNISSTCITDAVDPWVSIVSLPDVTFRLLCAAFLLIGWEGWVFCWDDFIQSQWEPWAWEAKVCWVGR